MDIHPNGDIFDDEWRRSTDLRLLQQIVEGLVALDPGSRSARGQDNVSLRLMASA